MDNEWSKFLEQDYEKIVVPNLQALHTEIWIGKKDYFLRKIVIGYSLPKESETTGATKEKMDIHTVFDAFTLTLDYQQSAINAPVAIEPPESPKDLMKELQKGPFGDARRKARDAKRMADIKTAQSALEIYSAKNHDAVYPKDEAKDWGALMKLLGIMGGYSAK